MTHKFNAFLAAALVGGLSATTPLVASENDAMMELALYENVSPWINDPAVIDAIRAQNEKTAGLSGEEIAALDAKWKAEAEAGSGPTIDPVMMNALSDFLRSKIAESDGMVVELFIMDARGLNVAVAEPTSDYWQGDEPKFSETFVKGADAVHMGDLEQDASSGSFQGQVSMTITDPETGKPIGAVTAGLRADDLM